MLRNAPVWTGTLDNNEDNQPPRLRLPDDDEGSIDFPEPQATVIELTLTRDRAMELTGNLITLMDDNDSRGRPEFKTRVLEWLNETTIKVLPREAKTTVFFWCQSFAPEWARKVERALENDLHQCDYEQTVPGQPVEMRSANMGMHALKKIYDIVKALPDDCVLERQSLVANCREVKEVLTCLNEKSQSYLSIISNMSTQCNTLLTQCNTLSTQRNTLSAHNQQLQELRDSISSNINKAIEEKTADKAAELAVNIASDVAFGVMEQLNEKRTEDDLSCLSCLFFSYKSQGYSVPEPLLTLAVNLLGVDGMTELDERVRRELADAGILDTGAQDDADTAV